MSSVLTGADGKFFKNHNYGKEMEEIKTEYKA
jgi:hypothetical protein